MRRDVLGETEVPFVAGEDGSSTLSNGTRSRNWYTSLGLSRSLY